MIFGLRCSHLRSETPAESSAQVFGVGNAVLTRVARAGPARNRRARAVFHPTPKGPRHLKQLRIN